MKIAIDARFYQIPSGLGTYVRELIAGLTRVDKNNHYFLLVNSLDGLDSLPSNFEPVLVKADWYSLADQWRLPCQLYKLKPDLVHFPHFNVPWLYRRSFVTTIHDLILMTYPSQRATRLSPLLFKLKFLAYKFINRSAVARSAAVLTVSNFSRSDIIKFFPWSANKVRVIKLASHWPISEPARPRQPLFIYVGNSYPHKNVETLVRAFDIFYARHQDYSLQIITYGDYFGHRLADLADQTVAAQAGALIVSHGLTDQGVAVVYKKASALILPSFYEGSSLSGLEAMSFGLPLIASDRTCLPEILGSAAIYFKAAEVS